MVGLVLNDISLLLVHFPPGQRRRAERIREVHLISFDDAVPRTA